MCKGLESRWLQGVFRCVCGDWSLVGSAQFSSGSTFNMCMHTTLKTYCVPPLEVHVWQYKVSLCTQRSVQDYETINIC